ncbi:hypothetical protein SKAU_G00014540 [Synaphobranchus kaupii]|uniref:Menorin-like domain-containing protein n=1 Tax=Synaphobranchus kaupii TaxID=118154 RepID=A0A9Q1GBU5_SYNKA|nr:hypothetical protein SKAU_G00014540 [Synaphobranchus kaupii]
MGARSPFWNSRFRVHVVAVFLIVVIVAWTVWNLQSKIPSFPNSGRMSEQTLDYFLIKGKINERDAANVEWYHAANSKSKITEALKSSAQMIEADIIMRGHDPKEPIMAHPPQTDSDVTLRDWLKEVTVSDKGIKLDFKSLQAVAPSMGLLEEVRRQLHGPVWINADILPGPGGKGTPLGPQAFLEAVGPGHPGDVLSLGWSTGWSPDTDNPGYSWEMVREMEGVCRVLKQSVTFPVRAALLPQSYPQLRWLLEQSDRYSLTVWTGLSDQLAMEDLLPYRQNIDKSRVYYDLLESQSNAFRKLPGYS